MPTVEMTAAARGQFAALPKVAKVRVLKRIEWLQTNWPESRGKSLRGSLTGMASLRTGDYRILYRARGRRIIIEKIGHRKDVYGDN
ncbi:MAG: type II toxin-antitoxin system RelE/ParE family toxin [Planctomycetaceae bacterium]